MKLPAGFEFAYPGGQEIPCVRRCAAEVMLCGRRLDARWSRGFVPVVQPADPQQVCAGCAEVLARMPQTLVVPEEGVCPDCGAEVPLVGGLVDAHQALVQTVFGPRFQGSPCDGEGMAPEVEG